MSKQLTLGLIKPDALERGKQGAIIDRILSKGFKIVAMKQIRLTKAQAEAFYAEHAARPFFASLTGYMVTGPIIALALEKENAIADWRTLMGATNPEKADAGTIRKDFAVDLEKNSVHGSDSETSAAREVPFFFNALEY
ncbi:MAG: nucleoside-diphosphate kinase [Nitrospinae bacterium]|nr:nucleoside-diphosphate kinase [Nitrospinota bacterium]